MLPAMEKSGSLTRFCCLYILPAVLISTFRRSDPAPDEAVTSTWRSKPSGPSLPLRKAAVMRMSRSLPPRPHPRGSPAGADSSAELALPEAPGVLARSRGFPRSHRALRVLGTFSLNLQLQPPQGPKANFPSLIKEGSRTLADPRGSADAVQGRAGIRDLLFP